MAAAAHEAEAEDPNQPQLVVREGVSEDAAAEARQRARGRNGRPDPRVFQATYIPLEGNFTSNLRGGDAFVQIGDRRFDLLRPARRRAI